MQKIARAFAAALLLALAAGAAYAVGEGRLQVTIVDEKGAPVPGVKVTITSPEFKFKQEKTTDAKGKFSASFVDATRKYTAKFEKEGFVTVDQALSLELGSIKIATFTMPHQSAGGTGEGGAQELTGTNKAILAYNAGVAALNAKDPAGAVAKFDEAQAQDPKLGALAVGYSAAADLFVEQKKAKEALAAIEQSQKIDPKGEEHALLIRYDASKELNQKDDALAALKQLETTYPSHETAVRLYNEGAEADRAKKTDVAIDYMERALKMDKGLEPAYSALAGLYTQKGEKAKAEAIKADMAKANITQTKESAYNEGVSLFNQGKMPEATKAFENAVTINPGYGRAHYMLGLCYASTDVAKAREHLQAFLKLSPTDPDAKTAEEMLKSLQ
ncbi:MAG TPA: tetratricopeptide repeat protein [Thermoanaerobaculia bacterium]